MRQDTSHGGSGASVEALETRRLFASGIGAFAPATNTWSLRSTASSGPADLGTFQFGAPVPVVGDWNGDGKDDIGSFNRNTATWSLRYGASAGAPDAGVFVFGSAGSLPVVGDWNGDGRDDIGVYVPKTATWSLRFGASAGPANAGTFIFGAKSAIPVAGDWNGDGTDGIGTFVPGKAQWTLRQTPNAGAANAGTFTFGAKNTYPVVGDWNGDGTDGIAAVVQKTATWSVRQTPNAGAANVGTFVFGSKNLIPVAGDFIGPVVSQDTLTTVTLKPMDLDLQGLQVQTSPITISISAVSGNGKLLANHLNSVGGIINTDEASAAMNNVLATTVDLLNAGDLGISLGSGSFDSRPASDTQIAELFVAPVHLETLGVAIDLTPVRLTVSAHAGEGLKLGNMLADLSNLGNSLVGSPIDVDTLNQALSDLLGSVNTALGATPAADIGTVQASEGSVLTLAVPAIDLNLLGLTLETDPLAVSASAQAGDGLLLGNVWTASLNTQDATPDKIAQMSNTANAVMARVFGALNASDLTVPSTLVNALTPALQVLLSPTLIAPAGSSAPILDLVMQDSLGMPATVDLLGLSVQSNQLDAHLSATTGDGQILGNLLYNVVNLTNTNNASARALLKALATNSTAPISFAGGTLTGATPAPASLMSAALQPLDLDLLGLNVQTDAITVNINAQSGDGKLLGNLLRGYTSLLNIQTVNDALSNALGAAVNLVNSVDLTLPSGTVGSGVFDSHAPGTTQVLQITLPPIHLDVAGAVVTTSPIHLSMNANAGDGLVLGNVLTQMAHLFDNPPAELTIGEVASQLGQMLSDLNAQIPGVPPADLPAANTGTVFGVTVPGINLNLLGMKLKTDAIVVDAATNTGDGMLLGNAFAALLGSIDGSPQDLDDVTTNLNALLAKVIGVFNASQLTISQGAIDALPSVLQELANPTLVNSQLGATASILDLNVSSASGTNPRASTGVQGAAASTGSIHFQLSATTGEGQILGNILFNVANLLNPGEPSSNFLYLLELASL
jgi:hypothetical protein